MRNMYRAMVFGLVIVAFAGRASAQCELQELLASDGISGDRFGVAVAIDGDAALVGASHGDDGASNAGTAYVWRLVGGVWGEEQELLAPGPGSNDHFGQAVALSGNVAVVGVPDDDDLFNSGGSVHVYRHDGASWLHEQQLTAFDGAAGDRFGWSVGVKGNVLVVGAKHDDDTVSNSGSAYIFRESSGTWIFEQKLTASDPADPAQFGDAVAIDFGVVVIGAWQDDDDGFFSGSAYVFRDTLGAWFEDQKLTASDATAFAWFGRSVDVMGDLVIVGAYGDGAGGSEAGAAYVYRYDGTDWVEEQKLTASDAAANDRFGWSAAIDGDRAVVGTRNSGAVYFYAESGGVWTETSAVPASDGASGDELGYSLSMDGTRAIAGAYQHDHASADAGAAYVFSTGEACDVGTAFCFGDGTGSACPCANESAVPGAGCEHSGGVGMRIAGSGTTSIATDDLTLTAIDCPVNNSGIFYTGTADLSPGNVLFDGLQCASGSVRRFQGQAQSSGSVSDTDFVVQAGAGYFVSGTTYHFQYWSRDVAAPSPCGAAANFSHGLAVTMTL